MRRLTRRQLRKLIISEALNFDQFKDCALYKETRSGLTMYVLFNLALINPLSTMSKDPNIWPYYVGDLAIKPSATPVKDPAAKTQTMESVSENVAYHKKMAFTHSEHGAAHESEVTNGGSADHDYASDHHHAAADAHKAAVDAHKKHGGDSKQYKSAADAAHKATEEAHETARDAGKIKRVSPSPFKFPKKPSMKKESYGVSGNKVSDSLLDAVSQVTDKK